MLLSCLIFGSTITGVYALNIMIVNSNNSAASGPFRLISSTPYDRQTLDNAPTLVSFTFSGPIRPDKSYIRVYNLNGDQLDVGELEVQGMTVSVTLHELTSGKYTIKLKAHCQCNDESEINNSFHFTVK